MPVRKVVLCDDHTEAVVLQNFSDVESLKIKSIRRSYLGYDPEFRILYKLHSDIDTKKPHKYRWLSMWNSISCTSIKEEKYWNKIEDALMAALNDDWKVIQVNGDCFENILSFLK